MNHVQRYLYESPAGAVSYAWDGQACGELWLQAMSGCKVSQDNPVHDWLQAYFQGKAIPLPPMMEAKTPFQARMRAALWEIPCGEVIRYGDLAKMLHSSPRAVGQALGANPLPLLVPCHRIVAASGLGGFSCGIEWKQWLLEFEHQRGADRVAVLKLN